MYNPTICRTAAGLSAAAVLSAILLAACGYRVAGRGALPAGVQAITVQVLENRSSETGIETLITNALINELNRRRQGSVTSTDKAGATLNGTIETISWDTVARRGSSTAAQRRVYVTISLQLTDKSGQTIWERSGLQAEQAYTVVEDNKLATENNRRQAIGDLSQRLAENVYRRLTDNF